MTRALTVAVDVASPELDAQFNLLKQLSRELLALVRRSLVGRSRNFVVEVSPELGDRLEVVGRRAPDVHPAQPAIRAPASRNCADRFSNGANRSLMRRTSSIESWDPAA